MINIFYQNKTLSDTLIIEILLNDVHKTICNKQYCLGFDDSNHLIFINIFNFSKYINLPNGLIFCNKEIIEIIKKITNYDLSIYLNNGIKIGKVIQIEPINGTHLHNCLIDVNQEQSLKIVCGASNVKKDMITVVATNMSRINNGKLILEGKVLNNFSQGMLCSKKELCIHDNQQTKGIIELPSDSIIGSIYKPAYKNL